MHCIVGWWLEEPESERMSCMRLRIGVGFAFGVSQAGISTRKDTVLFRHPTLPFTQAIRPWFLLSWWHVLRLPPFLHFPLLVAVRRPLAIALSRLV
jgi:hypothetical protein